MTTYRGLTRRGVPNQAAAVLMGVPRSTATRVPRTPSAGLALVPANKLDVMERARIMAVVNSARFVDLPPIQIYAQLLDEGVYLGSISTIYRFWPKTNRSRNAANWPSFRPGRFFELVATAPGQVYTWDITKLAGAIKGKYYDCYVMIDIFSRYIVGAKVHPAESAVLAAEMMAETFGIHGTPQVVHADRGTSMTSKTVAALLSDLEVTCVAFPAPGQQRQPLLGGLVQNVEVRPGVPGMLRQPRRRSTVHGYFRRGLQPHPPPHRHRAEHAC